MKQLNVRSKAWVVYLEGQMQSRYGKTGLAILREADSPVVAVIDSVHAGKKVSEVTNLGRDIPVVATVAEAVELGAEVLMVGVAPSGGKLDAAEYAVFVQAVCHGLSIVNGLHEPLAPRFTHLGEDQEIHDIRVPDEACLTIGRARSGKLSVRRVLTVGTDMSVGKMTAARALHKECQKRKIPSSFLATGQTGIMLEGQGIALDAVPVDFAAGAVEHGVLSLAADGLEFLFIEGQGSLLNPSSTATLPLIRGSQPTDLILVHKVKQQFIYDEDGFRIPSLDQVKSLYEVVASTCSMYPAAKVKGVVLNTAGCSEVEALNAIKEAEELTGVPAVDVLLHGAQRILDNLLDTTTELEDAVAV